MKNLRKITLISLTVSGLLYCSSCSYKCNGTWTQRKSFDNLYKLYGDDFNDMRKYGWEVLNHDFFTRYSQTYFLFLLL